MAQTIFIYKESETLTEVLYRFGPDPKHLGLLRLRKLDGDVEELVPVPVFRPKVVFVRAVHRVLQHWQRGDYPDQTRWRMT